jgi:histidyl-tRNA synthetase
MNLKLPKGTRDFSPKEQIVRSELVNTLKKTFELYGFSPLETPLIERFDVLSSKYAGGAEILKETFRLKDQGNRDLGLRYDLTVPMCRFVGMNPAIKMPFKRYQVGEVFRDGPVALARFRQFLQCDVDVVGSSSMGSDAEIISLISSAFDKLGFEAVIKVNSRKLMNDILEFCGISKEKQDSVILSIDKLRKFGPDLVKAELAKQNIDKKDVSKLMEIISIKGNNDEKFGQLKIVLKNSEGLDEIEELLDKLNKLSAKVDFDPSLARGLSYYTGTVVETFLKNSIVKSSVCAGGRYDKIIGQFLGKGEFPAMGVSFGLDRIYTALIEQEKPKRKTNTKLFIIPIKTLNESLIIAKRCRDSGINTDIDLLGKGPSKNLEYANSLGFPFVLFLGKKELEEGKFKLKDMGRGSEEMLDINGVIEKLKS